ncbi:MAG: CDGSH iron-sulfur domain-containing protein [Candidatus Wallbacteria bacterium]|nr:CDGSH iron-sulfur domain-containing protein [Candidatus Wallbacteria bacterium]
MAGNDQDDRDPREADWRARYWCACGLSRVQPYCDGSHKSTPFRPVPMTQRQWERFGKKTPDGTGGTSQP